MHADTDVRSSLTRNPCSRSAEDQRSKTRTVRVVLCAAALTLAVAPLWAETIYVNGFGGRNGVAGAPGDPGQNGTDAGFGFPGAGTIESVDLDPFNEVVAYGGLGGTGGAGGNGVGSPEDADEDANGGNGGAGGRGGPATANVSTTLTSGFAYSAAYATGGQGGRGGPGGTAAGAGTPGLGGQGGRSGNATATATAISADDGARAYAIARPGSPLFGTPWPYRPAAVGGTATARATASGTGTGTVTAIAEAGAGRPGHAWGVGFRGADGVAVIASASGSSSGTGAVNVSATQFGGDGGVGYAGADGGNGADSVMVNAVTGSSAGGALTLTQYAVAGSGGGSEGGATGRGGDASSSLTWAGTAGQLLDVTLAATAGDGGVATGTQGGIGGTSTVAADLTHWGDIRLTIASTGGNGGFVQRSGDGRNGTAGTLGPVIATSTGGGHVSIDATVRGGSGGGSEFGKVGSGATISLVNAIDGFTTGILELTQRAWGGSTGWLESGVAGQAGSASSSLVKSGSYEELRLVTEARGGSGGEHHGFSNDAGAGGAAAFAVSEASNSSGVAVTDATALGGWGADAYDSADPGPGGAAEASASADTTAGGTAARAYANAIGGMSGGQHNGLPNDNGGDAVSTATALGGGLGEVVASARAEGGAGGGLPWAPEIRTGAANAFAYGRNIGDADVSVTAEAIGGAGGSALGVHGGQDQQATAEGISTGAGFVSVMAIHQGGRGGVAGYGDQPPFNPGGNGGDSFINNAVTGQTRGTLSLNQAAIGGAGGDAYTSTTGGRGGAATAILTGTYLEPALLSAGVVATGGQGGRGLGLVTAPGSGGSATAVVDVTGAVTSASGEASGGDSNTDYYGRTLGPPGDAVSMVRAVGLSGSASATATARGGQVDLAYMGNATSRATAEAASGFHARALAEASGTRGGAQATAETSGGILTRVHATATAPLAAGTEGTTSTAIANAGIGFDGEDTASAAHADAVGLPDDLLVASVMMDDPAVQAVFSGDPLALLYARLGAEYAHTESGAITTFTSIAEFDIDTSAFPEQDILIGLLNPIYDESGFNSLRFQAFKDKDHLALVDKTFNDLMTAVAFFDDEVINLGSITEGVQGDLNLKFRLDLVGSAPTHRFGFEVLSSVVPLPPTAWLALTAFGLVAVRARRVARAVSHQAATPQLPSAWSNELSVSPRVHPIG